jgi:hypothetical protein
MPTNYATLESREWKRARQAAFIQDALAAWRQRPAHLMSFHLVSQQLQLGDVRYLDLQVVPLDQIAGSVDRYHDFNRAFLPRLDQLQDRWQRVERLIASGRDLPPIELYKVGQTYFVRDGHHRVSVARQYGARSIQAYVWECETEVPLEPGCDVDELLARCAHESFLEQTCVDRLCPGLSIRLTQREGYEELLNEINAFQEIITRIDRRQVAFDEAVTLWSEICYLPIVDIIQRRHILHEFPGRTEADLYLWLRRNLDELQGRLQAGIPMELAADGLAQDYGEKTLLTRPIRRAGEWVVRSSVSTLTALRRFALRAVRRVRVLPQSLRGKR